MKLTTPVPELEAENVPLKVAEKLLDPATGTVCVIVRVKVPDAAITPFPEKKVWKLPKLEPVGVFKLVLPSPVNVIISALPMPPRNVTELVPLPVQPPQVNTPEVENVTGSAFATDAAKNMNPATMKVIKSLFRCIPIFCSFVGKEP